MTALIRRIFLAAGSRMVSAGLALILLAGIAGCGFTSHEYNGVHLDPPLENDGFELASADGAVRAGDFQGQWLMLFFGYTNCPDVCPATLSVLKRAIGQLDEAQAGNVRVAMISVDPERDTPERLVSYTRAFDPSFVGLTGTEDQVSQAASTFGIYYARAEGSEESGYAMDHTASVLLLDPEGKTRMIWSHGTPAEDIAEDLRHVMQH